jgi:predicted Zn-dependent protease
MNIRRKLLLGLFFSSTVAVGLYLFPRSVVTKEGGSTSISGTDSRGKGEVVKEMDASHIPDPTLQKQMEELKASLISEASDAGKARLSAELASVFMKANQFDSAGAWFESAMRYDSGKHFEYEIGTAYFEGLAFISAPSKLEANAELARKWLDLVPKSDSRYSGAQARSALTWVNSASPMKGILKLRELSEAYPDDLFIAAQLGQLSFQSGQFEKAADRFRKVISLDKSDSKSWFYLASSLMQINKKQEALEAAKTGRGLAKEEELRNSFADLIKQIEK